MAPVPAIIRMPLSARSIGDHTDILARASVLFPLLSTFFVGTRLWVRKRPNVGLRGDDIWICISLLFSWAFFAMYFTTAEFIDSRAIAELPLPEVQNLIRRYLVQEMLYFAGLTSVKISIILFYLRSFGTTKKTRWLIMAMMMFVVAYAIARIFSTLFQCRPFSYFWDRTQPGTCVNYYALLFSHTIINMVTDVVLLAFPMPIVWQLHIPLRQKVAICGVFCVGGLACTSAIVRIWVIQKIFTEDVGSVLSDDAAPKLVLCGALEFNIGLISSCLPTLRTSLKRASRLLNFRASPKASQTASTPSPRLTLDTITQPGTVTLNAENGDRDDSMAVGTEIDRVGKGESRVEMVETPKLMTMERKIQMAKLNTKVTIQGAGELDLLETPITPGASTGAARDWEYKTRKQSAAQDALDGVREVDEGDEKSTVAGGR
ncbi:hypothetical protein M501DRAFT_1054858 [Patellaria atrata CBS 101060]|uniref:Rhodopsin domain-containing protein n=1 Tax=Patellaria atrata CBS 101060 TaxID=1346257 RepID=A0A9P4VUM2_9PEZI|nr:hypothetical protein M501DRAFT_1054858 [Patellaria atrata CBS 101060]